MLFIIFEYPLNMCPVPREFILYTNQYNWNSLDLLLPNISALMYIWCSPPSVTVLKSIHYGDIFYITTESVVNNIFTLGLYLLVLWIVLSRMKPEIETGKVFLCKKYVEFKCSIVKKTIILCAISCAVLQIRSQKL